MSSLPRVAIAGATGNLGPAILKQLLDAGFPVTVLSRKGSNSTDALPAHPNQTIKKVDYGAVGDIQTALQGVEIVVCTLAANFTAQQKVIIDASIAAGVKRYIPSEFGSDTLNARAGELAVFQGKIEIQKYLAEKVKENPNFSYTLVISGPFFDWGLKVGFLINPAAHSATLYDGGDVPFSVSLLSTIGKAVVGVAKNLSATENKPVYFHDTVITQNQIINITKKIDSKEWSTTEASAEAAKKEANEELSKPNPDVGKAMMGLLFACIFGEGYGCDFTGKLSNDILGLPIMSEAEVSEVVKSML